jgi:hypothetical protein
MADKAMAFTSLNGPVDVTLPSSIKAALKMRSDRGDVFTDFDVVSLSAPPEVRGNRGRYVMNTNRNSAFRVGTGGERHTFNTLNGDILVRKAN